MMTSNFQIHMDPSIFPDPSTFAPQRWLDNPKLTQYLVPFAKGSRACLGLKYVPNIRISLYNTRDPVAYKLTRAFCSLAMSELYIGIATIFRRFHMQIVDTPKEREVECKHIMGIGFPDMKAEGIKVKVLGERVN